jgi:iron complex transport system substrate-binding protein
MHLLVAVVLVAVATGCSRDHAHAPDVATRIVSLGPATTEALFAVGAGDRVVGRSRYCDWPPEASKLPAVGGIEPDVEGILQLKPDLVVGPSGAWSTKLAQTLDGHGIATWFPAEIRTLAGVDALVLDLGARTGHVDGAQRVVARIDAGEQAVDRAVAGAPHPRVLLVVGLAPVVAAGPGSFADDMLKHAGAANVIADGGPWPVVGFERIAELDPDVIVDASVAESGGATQVTAQAAGWGALRAVRGGHVVALGDERVLRPGPRVAEGLAVLAHALHPGAVP